MKEEKKLTRSTVKKVEIFRKIGLTFFFRFLFVILKSRNIHAEKNIRTAKEEHKNAC